MKQVRARLASLFRGRIGRLAFMLRGAILVISLMTLATILGFLSVRLGTDRRALWWVVQIIGWVAVLGVYWVGFVSLTVRRLHDLNLSGSYALVCFIPVAGAAFSAYLLFKPGKRGSNRYGSVPGESTE